MERAHLVEIELCMGLYSMRNYPLFEFWQIFTMKIHRKNESESWILENPIFEKNGIKENATEKPP